MADKKLNNVSTLTSSTLASNDYAYVEDVSASNEQKKVTITDLAKVVGGQLLPFYLRIPSAAGTRYYKLAEITTGTRNWPLHIGGSNSGGACFDVEASISPTSVVAYATKVHQSSSVVKLYYVSDSSGCSLYVSVNGYSSVSIMSYATSNILVGSQVDALPQGAVEVIIGD